MKRRTFLTATSTIGIVSAASGGTVVSSVYNDISSNILLEEFTTSSKNALNKFVSSINENTEAMGLDSNLGKKLAMPVKIIKNEIVKGDQTLLFKCKAGNNISISMENGKCKLRVMES